MNKIRSKIFILFLLTLIFGCQSRSYIFFAFSFPPGTVPHETGWSHIGKVIVSTKPGRTYIDRYEKEIVISVKDTEEKTLLDDKILVVAGSIETKISWNRFERLEIVIDENLSGSSQESLEKSSDSELIKLIYRFDPADNRFERVKA
jgi:hypothetical protein